MDKDLNIDFGMKRTIVRSDDGNKIETTTEKYVNNEVVYPVTVEYTINVRVNNELEEAAVFHNFSREYNGDTTMLNPSINIKRSKIGDKNGYYYVVKKWERIKH